MKYTTSAADRQQIREGWAELLSRYPWDCFATLTFQTPRRDPFEVVKAVEMWLRKWNESEAVSRGLCDVSESTVTDAYGRAISKRKRVSGPWVRRWKDGRAQPVYVIGVEPHQSGSLHAHAIIKHADYLPDLCRGVGWEIWRCPRSQGGMGHGMARIEPVLSRGAVADYVTKYVTKGGELVLSRSFDAVMLPAA
jgi:hypothetical protein